MSFPFFDSINFAIVDLQSCFPWSCTNTLLSSLTDVYRKHASNRTMNEVYLHLTMNENEADVIALITGHYWVSN